MLAGDSLSTIESVFAWIEGTPLSDWITGPSMLAFPTILSAHTLGMGFLAGTNAGIDLRLLGVAGRVPISLLEKFYPVMWLALVVNFASGTLLFIGYPYKAVTNPVFYVKMALVVAAVYLAVRIRREVLRAPDPDDAATHMRAKWLAIASLSCWAGVITAGRLLAYTYNWLRVGIPNNF